MIEIINSVYLFFSYFSVRFFNYLCTIVFFRWLPDVSKQLYVSTKKTGKNVPKRQPKSERGAAPSENGNFNYKPMWLYFEHLTSHLNHQQMTVLQCQIQLVIKVKMLNYLSSSTGFYLYGFHFFCVHFIVKNDCSFSFFE